MAWIAFFEDRRTPEGRFDIGEEEFSFLLNHAGRLAALAQELNVAPLTALESYTLDDLRDYLDQSEWEEVAAQMDAPSVLERKWFAPADGLTSVRALATHLDHPSTDWGSGEIERRQWEGVVRDLEALARELEAAHERGTRFFLRAVV